MIITKHGCRQGKFESSTIPQTQNTLTHCETNMQTTSTCSNKCWQEGPDQSGTKLVCQNVCRKTLNLLKNRGMQHCEMTNGFTITTSGFSTGDKLELSVFPPIQKMTVLLKPRSSTKIKTRVHFLWISLARKSGSPRMKRVKMYIERHTLSTDIYITLQQNLPEMNLHRSLALINLSSYPEIFQFPRGRLTSPPYTFQNAKQEPRSIPTTTQAMISTLKTPNNTDLTNQSDLYLWHQ